MALGVVLFSTSRRRGLIIAHPVLTLLAVVATGNHWWFDGIVACGLHDHGVTSLSELAGRDITVPEVRPLVVEHLDEVFGLALGPAPPPEAFVLASAISTARS